MSRDTLLELDLPEGRGVTLLGSYGLQQLAAGEVGDEQGGFSLQGEVDFFEPNCAVVLSATTLSVNEHPFNAYNTNYPYCRTAIRARLDDPDANPLLAQVTSFSRYLSLRVVGVVCGAEVAMAAFRLRGVYPALTRACAVASFLQPGTGQGFLVVDGTQATLPVQALLELVAVTGEMRVGWVTILPPGWFTP